MQRYVPAWTSLPTGAGCAISPPRVGRGLCAHPSLARNRTLAAGRGAMASNRSPAAPLPQADASTRTTSAHKAATKMAMRAKAPAKPTPIPAQSRPGGSVLTARRPRSASLCCTSLSLIVPPTSRLRVALVYPRTGVTQTVRHANHSREAVARVGPLRRVVISFVFDRRLS